jgi:uncharacterized protein with GYD domain
MGTYVILMNYTDQGVKAVKESPARVKGMYKAVEAAGGKITAMYATMGQYDLVAIAEGPSDQVALALLLGLGMAGNVRTTTLKAFGMEEFAALLKQLP